MLNGKTVEDNLVSLIAKMGEKITIGRVKTFNQSVGAKNFNYLHTVVKDNLIQISSYNVSIETKDSSDINQIFW